MFSILPWLALSSLSLSATAQHAGSFVQAGNTLVNAMMRFLGNDELVYILDKTEGNAAQIDRHPAWDSAWSIIKLPPNLSSPDCQWYDNPAVLSMQETRWYSAAEALGDGTIVLIGGFTSGGYVNRNMPNVDPAYEGGGATPTYEFYPICGPATVMNFMVTTRVSTLARTGEPLYLSLGPLPDMPNGVVCIYPVSGAVAMLPFTPATNYTPTLLFCGGSDMPADYYGNYRGHFTIPEHTPH
ncbi:hypothetical protein EV363DRAFT_1546046 [Boletus edulis]|nr:hypothetical protein EV363DRAFT_1546046 [Boletus edulis]